MKVIILTAKFGMGHISAANSIKEDILNHDSKAVVEVMDFYEYSMPHLGKAIYTGFNMLVKYGSGIYSRYYIENDQYRNHNDILTRKFASSAVRLIEEKQPDMIVSTFPIISQGIGLYKKEKCDEIPLVTCITDISSHYEWINTMTDRYLVPCNEIKDEIMKKGVSEEKIIVYGIPVSDKFRTLNMKKKLLKYRENRKNKTNIINFGKYKKEKNLLIMGGGFGILPKNTDFYERLNNIPNLHTTIVTGNNREVYDRLDGKYENITVLGYSNNVSELMDNADAVLTKPGGITLFEAIYSHTPIISFRTTLPNEVKNIEFIEDNNFGLALFDSAERSINRIEKFINDEKNLSDMKTSMENFLNGLADECYDNYIFGIEKPQMAIEDTLREKFGR